jgi:cob(I)alamin adenosyltransferase
MSRIATGTGDKGQTGLFDGSRVSKAHPLIRAFGDVDELDAAIGVAIAESEKQAVKRALQQVQHELFALKSDLATPRLASKKIRRMSETDIENLEKRIDDLEASLPELKHFIAYGGTDCAAHLQLARGIARRAERSAWEASEAAGGLNEHAIVYLNRLSDYLFLLARKVNQDSGSPEEEMRIV